MTSFRAAGSGSPLAAEAGSATPCTAAGAPEAVIPDFGPHVTVFGPGTPAGEIRAAFDAAARQQSADRTGGARHTFLFEPGRYELDAPLGCRTSVAGLGLSPDDVTLDGALRTVDRPLPDGGDRSPADLWRSAENLTVRPADGVSGWTAARAASLRRVRVHGRFRPTPRLAGGPGGVLGDGGRADGRGAGAWECGAREGGAGDPGARYEGTREAGSGECGAREPKSGQWQPWPHDRALTGGRPDGEWNAALAGAVRGPRQRFPGSPGAPDAAAPPARTSGPAAPASHDKPFLYLDRDGRYRVFLPAPRPGGTGAARGAGGAYGSSVPIHQFFVARPSDPVHVINRALAQGRHLLFTPGVYRLAGTVRIKWSRTVVLGLGFVSLTAAGGVLPMAVDDPRGVRIAGVLFDAAEAGSPVLLEIGAGRGRRGDPACLHDVFFRTDGADRDATGLVVHGSDVLADRVRSWRTGQGDGAGRSSLSPGGPPYMLPHQAAGRHDDLGGHGIGVDIGGPGAPARADGGLPVDAVGRPAG